MAKFTKEQVEQHKRFITVLDMQEIAKKTKYSWHTLKRALWGETHYDFGDAERQEMIIKASKLIKQRAINALDVINPKTVK